MIWLVILALLQPAVCSLGDRSAEFRACTRTCVNTNCSQGIIELPLHLRVLHWSCPEDCQYTCMHKVTKEDIRTGKPIRQFYGKVGLPVCSSALYYIMGMCVSFSSGRLFVCWVCRSQRRPFSPSSMDSVPSGHTACSSGLPAPATHTTLSSEYSSW